MEGWLSFLAGVVVGTVIYFSGYWAGRRKPPAEDEEPEQPPSRIRFTFPDAQAAIQAGYLMIEEEQAERVEQYLLEQRIAYEAPGVTKADLIEVLLNRDRLLVTQGREIAQGKQLHRMLKEFVRGATAQLSRSEALGIEDALTRLGFSASDRRQIAGRGNAL